MKYGKTPASGKLWNYYDRAQLILRGSTHPKVMDITKVKLHKWLMDQQNVPFEPLTLAINNEGGQNPEGIGQRPCTLCGDCCSGCNQGAKNILTVNYLPRAKKNGAEIYTCCEVLYVEKNIDGSFTVHINRTKKGFKGKITIRAEKVVLGAGSMGSTEILMRSKMMGLDVSDQLGQRVSANGDMMGLCYNSTYQTDMIGYSKAKSSKLEKVHPGQAIMATGLLGRGEGKNAEPDLMKHFMFLDGTIPTGLAGLVGRSVALFTLASRAFKFRGKQLARMLRDIVTPIRCDMNGALNHSLLFFACGHDSASGVYQLSEFYDRPSIQWKNILKEESYVAMSSEMKECTEKLGGFYVPDPRSTIFGRRIMTTHPLGGCPMAKDVENGVVDHRGRVFNPRGGFHENLYVVDAAIIPRSLGATPLLTISALAERIAEFMAVN